MSKFVNLTPHSIRVASEGGSFVDLPSEGVARCATSRQPLPSVAGFRLVRQAFGQVTGLPDPAADTTYVVSALVLAALAGTRQDVVAPDTGPDAIRENGQIVAVLGFVS